MDPHRPESEEQPNSTSAEDQVSDEECEEPAARSRAHASQNRFDLIKAKTSTGLKKLRSSLGAWRREESVDSTGEPKSRTSNTEPSAGKARDDSSTEKSDQEKQTSKQSEYPKVWDLSFDSQAPQSLPAVSRPVRDSFTVDTESREAQPKPTRPRPGDVRSPASLSTAQRFLEEKNPTTPFKYVPQREILPLSLPLPAVPQHKKDPKVIQQALSPQPPRVPPRPPPRDWVDPLQIQHSALVGRHVLEEAGQVVVDSLTQEVSFTPANPDNTLSSNSLERVVTCKDGIHLSTAHQSDLNPKMQDVEIGSPTGIAQDKTDDQRQSKNKEAFYFANGVSINLQTEDKKKGLDKKEIGYEGIAPSPPSNRQTQNQIKRVPLNAGCDVNSQSPLYSPFGHGRRDQSSPPVLKVHSKQKRIEPSQKRVIEVNHYVLYDESTSKLPVPSGTAQERPLPSPKFEPIQETAGSVSLKYENSRPTKLLAEAQSVLEPSHKLSTPRRSGHPQRDTLSGSIPKPGAPSQNAAEDQCIEEQPKARAVSHHIIPNRPAPKPPSVRSTVVQYPGPMKGYTVSATGATEAHPPPLPPPPLSLRPSAPPVPSPPPRYKYYDVTEPSPYMPTTEPLPEKARGVSPLGSKPAGWRGHFFRFDTTAFIPIQTQPQKKKCFAYQKDERKHAMCALHRAL